jgi:hypothetical protein
MPKKYQIVLQFPSHSISDYDEMVALEDLLIEKLGTSAKVDSHDCGSGEMNIFIFADEPRKVFAMIKTVIPLRKTFEKLVAAYRETTGEDYTILWPDGYDKPFKIT